MEPDISLLLNRLVELERDVLYRTPALPGEDEFRYLPGQHSVLVSAPHGAAHFRNGRLKEEDEFTAGIACLLGELSGSHVLYARRQSESDPNYYSQAPFKHTLKEIIRNAKIRFVLDLHGASEKHGFGLALGTMSGKSCREELPLILSTLAEHGFSPAAEGSYRLDIDNHFTGGGGLRQETITRFTWEVLGVAAAQIELNSRLRVVHLMPGGRNAKPYHGDLEMIGRTVLALGDLVKRLS